EERPRRAQGCAGVTRSASMDVFPVSERSLRGLATPMRGAALVIALALCAETSVTSAIAAEPCALEPGETHTVTSIIDAETLLLDDGSQVRLIGALMPRSSGEGAVNRSDPARAAVE